MTNAPLPDPARLGFAIGILSQLFQSRASALLAPEGLTYGQFMLLGHLARTGASSISDVAAAVEMNQPGVTKAVQKLERRGEVAVRADPADARRRVVAIAAQGEATLTRCITLIGAGFDGWLDGWSRDEVIACADQVERLGGWLDSNRLD